MFLLLFLLIVTGSFSNLHFDGAAPDGSHGLADKVHVHLGGVFLQLGQHLKVATAATHSSRVNNITTSGDEQSVTVVTWAMLACEAKRIMMSSFSSLT